MRNDYGSVGASVGAQTNAPPVPGFLECTAKSLLSAREQIDTAIVRLEGIADRIFGSVPEKLGKESGQTNPVSSCQAYEIDRAGSVLSDRIRELFVQIERLERI